MQYRLLAMDLDGTLLGSTRRLTNPTREALGQAAARGLALAVVTGRSVGATRHYMRLLSRVTRSRVIGAGCNGGAVLAAGGGLLATYPIPPTLLLPAIDILREAGLLVSCYTRSGVVVDRPWRHLFDFVGGHERTGRGLVAAWNYTWINRIRPAADLRRWARDQREPVLKVLAYARPEGRGGAGALERAAGGLEQRLPGLHRTQSAPNNLELTAPGVHKARALRTLSEVLHIPREAIMAVGDGLNDLEMLTWAGLGVAMGNAWPEVAAVAGWTAPTCDQDGVAAAVHRFILADPA